MKRAIAQRTRRGSPPLPRQRTALRVVQLTFVGLAVAAGSLAYRAWQTSEVPLTALDGSAVDPLIQVIFLAIAAGAFLVAAVVMGFRTVRGPRPPDL